MGRKAKQCITTQKYMSNNNRVSEDRVKSILLPTRGLWFKDKPTEMSEPKIFSFELLGSWGSIIQPISAFFLDNLAGLLLYV